MKAIIKNSSKERFKVKKGQRIVQGIFLPRLYAQFNHVDQLTGDEDAHSCFGSTGSD